MTTNFDLRSWLEVHRSEVMSFENFRANKQTNRQTHTNTRQTDCTTRSVKRSVDIRENRKRSEIKNLRSAISRSENWVDASRSHPVSWFVHTGCGALYCVTVRQKRHMPHDAAPQRISSGVNDPLGSHCLFAVLSNATTQHQIPSQTIKARSHRRDRTETSWTEPAILIISSVRSRRWTCLYSTNASLAAVTRD